MIIIFRKTFSQHNIAEVFLKNGNVLHKWR